MSEQDLNGYVKDLSFKYHRGVEHLTREQFEIALKQAIESGDFVRATMVEHSPFSFKQGVYYYPYQLKQELDQANDTITKLREALEFYANPNVWGVDSPGAMTAIDPCDQEDMFHQEVGITVRGGRLARAALKECFGEEDQ